MTSIPSGHDTRAAVRSMTRVLKQLVVEVQSMRKQLTAMEKRYKVVPGHVSDTFAERISDLEKHISEQMRQV